MTRWVVLVVEDKYDDPEEIGPVPQHLCRWLKQHTVRFILRQRNDNPNEVLIECALAEETERRHAKLLQHGYRGPIPSDPVNLLEGQVVEISILGNVATGPFTSKPQITFRSGEDNRLQVQLMGLESKGHEGLDGKGSVAFFALPRVVVSRRKIKKILDKTHPNTTEVLQPKRLCELPLHVPVTRFHIGGKSEERQSSLAGVETYFYFIKEEVSTDWMDLAFHLGFEWADIKNIAGRNHDDKSRCLDMLREWQMREGDAATIEVLMEAMSLAGLQSVVDGFNRFSGNLFSSMPVELRGPEMTRLYNEACRQGSLAVHSTRIPVVGQYRSGKTCFINRLMGEPVRLDEPITDGIQIITDVQTKTWKKSPEEIDELAGTLLRTEQEMEASSGDTTVPLSQTENLEKQTEPERSDTPTAITEEATNVKGDKPEYTEGESEKPQTFAIPDNVVEAAEKMQKAGITEEELGTAEHPRLSFWDFGGQATYYGTHHCFITYRGVYILVMSLEQKLSDPVPDLDNRASVDNLKTGGDYLDHWLNTVYTHTLQHTRRPPVIIVLTHKDRVSKEDIEKYKEEIWSHLQGKAAGRLVMPEIFAVDNTTEDAAVDEIRDYIRQVARGLPHMGEEIPIPWLHLNSKMKTKREEGNRFCRFQEIADLAQNPDINITDRHTLAMVLTFLHDRGDVIFFNEPSLRDDVTLQPQVMIDVFKTIITVPEYQQDRQTNPEVRMMWERLEQEGVLSDELLTRIWEEKDRQLEKPFLMRHKSFLKALMEKFYLLCNAKSISDVSEEAKQEEIYFVPALISCELERDNAMLYPGNVHICPQALYFVFSEKFLPSGMFCRLQALCVRRFGLQESRVYAGCARFPTDDEEQAYVITKVNHYLKVELLSSSNVFTEGLRVRKFLSSALFEIKEKWIPCIQYELCCATREDGDEPDFRPLSTGKEVPGQLWGFPPLFRTVWMPEFLQSHRTENLGGDGPVILQPKGDPGVIVGMRTIGPVLDTMELGGGLTLDQCDQIRKQQTPIQRVLNMKRQGELDPYMLGAAVEMCLPEFEDLFWRKERGKELVILYTDDYTEEFVSPLETAASEAGVPCQAETIASTDTITEKTVELLLDTNTRMAALIISPQALHHRHWSNLDYEFPVRNEKLLLPILLYPKGSRDRMVRVLQQRAPVLCSMERVEILMEGDAVSELKLMEILQKVVIDEEEDARLYQISQVVCDEWTRLGQELKLTRSVLDNISADDNTQAALQMLKAWRTKTPHGPLHYLPQLQETLQNIGRPDLAAAVQETYREYRKGVQLTELSPDMNEDNKWSLHLPGEGKYLCRRTDLGVVTPYPLHVTYRTENWSDYSWPQEEGWMPVGPLFFIQCEDVEGPVDILLPHVLHLADTTEVTREDLQVVHVVGNTPELLPVTELTPSHAVTRFKKGSKFGVVGKNEKVSSVSRKGLLTAFRSLEDSDLSILKVYIVSNSRAVQEAIERDETKWQSSHCRTTPCQLYQGRKYYLRGEVTNGGDVSVSIDPEYLIFEDTLDTNKFYTAFRVEVSRDIWSSNTSRLHLELLEETNNDEIKKISQLKLGSYKRSYPTEETDSGVSTPTERLETVGRRLATLSTSDGNISTERSARSQSPPTVPVKRPKVSKRRQADDGAGPSWMQTESRAEVDVTQYFDKVISSVSYKWDDLARKLGFERGEIKAIENTPALRDPEQWCREVLERWENRKAGGATLRVLKQALIDIGERKTAESL